MSQNVGAPSVPQDTARQSRLLVSMGALMLGMLLAALDQTIVATALPTIVSDLGGMEHLSWVVTAYLLASTAATPLWGKLGDQYGRKKLYQLSIVLFLGGSALCGLSRNMLELILFRGLQGLGGGGLMVLSIAIVGDLVSPSERGKYQGLFGAVFGTTSVIGPLVGGLFTEHLSWRWVFYVNIPIGAIALAVIATVLHIPAGRTKHTIDYLGTLLIACVATCLVLIASLGGSTWPWDSAEIIGLLVLGIVLAVVFVKVEEKAAEPVLPMRLFRLRTFALSTVISFVIGFSMFGATTYMPTFLQVVRGVTPTMSGVYMLPMVMGMLIASTGSGQIISRTGRWKVFPIAGTGIAAIGFLLLSRLSENSSDLRMSIYFFVFGFGLGLVMQVVVLIVQNAVDYKDLGVATSGATFFRSIGSSFGVAIFGTLFNSHLAEDLNALLKGHSLPPGISSKALQADPQLVGKLPEGLREEVLRSYSDAITGVFLYAIPVVLFAFVLAWFFKEDKLRGSVTVPDQSQTYASNPVERSSYEEAARALSLLGCREGRRKVYMRITERAGYDLHPASSWILLRIKCFGLVDPVELSERTTVPMNVIFEAAREVEARGLVVREGLFLALTEEGMRVAERLAKAREESLAELLGDWWTPDRPSDLTRLVQGLTMELSGSDGECPHKGAPPRSAAQGDKKN